MATFAHEGAHDLVELVRDGRAITERRGADIETRSYASDTGARDMFDARVLRLYAQAWHLAVGDADFGLPAACDPAQERAILTATDDRAARLAVYTDWLIERGDPCGELASLRARHEREPDPALGGLIQRVELERGRALFGLFECEPDPALGPIQRAAPGRLSFERYDKPRLGRTELLRPRWADGWIDALDIGTSSGTLVALALLAPMARFVRGLHFHRGVSKRVRIALARALRAGQIRWVSLATERDAQLVLDLLPGLERVRMSVRMAATGHPTVRRLEIATFGVTALSGVWPCVETVAVRLTPHLVVPRVDDLLPPAALPALRTVELSGEPAACDAFAAQLPLTLHLVRT